LKNGVTNECGQKIKSYIYLNNSDEICTKYFGTVHLNKNSYEYDGSDLFGSLLSDAHLAKQHAKKCAPKDVEVTLKCKLAEFYNGSAKKACYERDQVCIDNRTYRKVTEEQVVEVKPGQKLCSTMTFKGKGNEEYGHPRSNLIVKFAEEEEPECPFKRCGQNLVYTHDIGLRESFNSCPI